MKKLKYIFILCIATAVLTSCGDDEPSLSDQIKSTPNVAGFSQATMPMSGVSDGTEYNFNIRMQISGPRLAAISSSVTIRVSVDTDQSTAVEGTHFALESKELTIAPGQNNLGVLPITLLTDGIVAPLAENPVLVLKVESTSGDKTVIGSGKSLVVNLLYLCPGDLSGNFSVTIDHARCNSAPYDANFPFTVTIEPNADGSWYLTAADGGFVHRCTGNSTLNNFGNINEVCGVIQPTSDLRFGSLDLGTIVSGSWDQDTGVLQMSHVQSFTGNWPDSWNSTYVRQ